MIGLFGREKGYDSNKAIEIFDYLAQRDIFCMRNSDENSDQATIEGFQDVANNRHSDPKFRIPFGKCCGKLRPFFNITYELADSVQSRAGYNGAHTVFSLYVSANTLNISSISRKDSKTFQIDAKITLITKSAHTSFN